MMTKTSSVTFEIDKGHRLYKYCDRLTRAAGALWNAALFRVMNGTSMCGKRESVMTPSERSVWTELTAALPAIRNEPWFLISSAMFLDSAFMNAFLPATGCEEYLFPFLPRSSARCVVKEACAAVRNYQKAVETYGKSRKKTSVKPRPQKPRSTKAGAPSSFTGTNAASSYGRKETGLWYAASACRSPS